MKLNATIRTNGDGLWSDVAKNVKVTHFDAYPTIPGEMDCGEVRAYFTKRSWDISRDGLIYTDSLWLKEFKQLLKKQGFSSESLKHLNYSEQGMQGKEYVSLDCDGIFLEEYMDIVIGAMC